MGVTEPGADYTAALAKKIEQTMEVVAFYQEQFCECSSKEEARL